MHYVETTSNIVFLTNFFAFPSCLVFSLVDTDFENNPNVNEEGKHVRGKKKKDSRLFDTNTEGYDSGSLSYENENGTIYNYYYYDSTGNTNNPNFVEYGEIFAGMETYQDWKEVCQSMTATYLGYPDGVNDENLCVPNNCEDGQNGATWPECGKGRNTLNKDKMMNFGVDAGDTAFERCDDCSINVTLDQSYNFMGHDYDIVFLSSNGHISFEENDEYVPPTDFTTINYSGQPAFSAFWTDLDVRRGGEIFYRQTEAQSDLDHLNNMFDGAYTFSWAFVATFNRVALYDMWCVDRAVTFQMIIARHAFGTRGIFIYGDLEICPGYDVDPVYHQESWYS